MNARLFSGRRAFAPAPIGELRGLEPSVRGVVELLIAAAEREQHDPRRLRTAVQQILGSLVEPPDGGIAS